MVFDHGISEESNAPVPVRVRPGEARRALLAAPPPELRYRRRTSALQSARNVWADRELLRSLTERQLRSRYKQAVLGFVWALAAPLSLLLVFVVFVQRFADINTNGVPYALFAFIGLLSWTFFSSGVSGCAASLLGNTALLNKTACPRELFPLSAILVAIVDTCVAATVLLVLFVVNQEVPRATTVYVPALMVIQLAFTVGVGMILAIMVVYVRDLRHALPLGLQLGLLITPIAYGFAVIPSELRWVYSLANPLGPVIDGYRRTMLEGRGPQWDLVGLAALSSIGVLCLGFWLLKRLEGGVVDVT